VIAIVACTLAILRLFGAVVRQSRQINAQAAEIVGLESDGASILHETTSLLAELVAAQSAAVRGTPVAADRLRKALDETEEQGGEYAGSLQTGQRLKDLRAQIEATLTRGDVGRAAYDAYGVLVQLAMDLEHVIGDTSHLVHDPDLDSFYLMDAAIVRLPNAIVLAGKAADLVALAGGKQLSGEDAITAAVARFGVSSAAEETSAGLSKSIDVTARSDLGTNITERLDAFKAAADAFAPPTILFELSGTVEAADLAANAQRVSAAADPLAHRLLSELQVLLDQRAARLASQWRFTAVAGGAAAAVALLLLWLVAVPRLRAETAVPPSATPARHMRPSEAAVGSLAYAREVLDGDRTVHVGRAAGPRTRGPDDAG
jgi:hypothetical protein